MESLQELGVEPMFTAILKKTKTKFVVSSGSVIDFTGQGIVNAANTGCLGGSGIDGAINARGGTELRIAREALPEISEGVRCPEGEARVTVGGNIPAEYIIHAVGPMYPKEGPFSSHDSVLSRAYQNALVQGQKRGIKTIAFSLLGSGIFKGGRALGDILLIGVETVVQCAYKGLEEVHMVAAKGEELTALLRTTEDFFSKQVSTDGHSTKKHDRSMPIGESSAKRQKTIAKETDSASKTLGGEIEHLQEDEDSKKPEESPTAKEPPQTETLGPASVTPATNDSSNTIAKSVVPNTNEKISKNNAKASSERQTPEPKSSSPQKEKSTALTPISSKPTSEVTTVQGTPIHIKRSHRIQILLLQIDQWFKHIFRKYLDNPQKILNCFPGSSLTPRQQSYIVAAFKTIYPQLRTKLRNSMNSYVERRNLVQLCADVDEIIATQCCTPDGTWFKPPVETAAHLQAVFELKIIEKAERELDAKILESTSEIQELENLYQELKREDSCSTNKEICNFSTIGDIDKETLTSGEPRRMEASS